MTQPTGTLAAALAAVQAHLPDVHKGETAVVPTKTGGKYTYTYASLSDISRAILPLLGANGLAWLAKPLVRPDGRVVLEYKLLHSSGEQEMGEYPLPASGSPQELGSAITYARRYALCSVTGIAPDDDDDGAAAGAGYRQGQQAPARTTPEPTPAPASKPMLGSQRRQMFALFTDLGREGRDEQLSLIQWVVRRPLESRGDLTQDEAQEVIAELRRRMDLMSHSGPDPRGEQAAHDLRGES